MASTQIPPFIVRLPSVASVGDYQNTPTLEVGDVTIRVDTGSRANIATLPTVSGYDVLISIDDSELPVGWNSVSVDFLDVAGSEWRPVHVALFADLFSIADPLMHTVPGSYPSGTAGNILGRLSGQLVTVSYPLDTRNNTITVKQGDSYYIADGRAIEFSSTAWPSLVGATITFVYGPDDTVLSMSVTSVDSTQTVALELTEAQLAAILPANYAYQVDAVLSNGHPLTLVEGRFVVV